MARGQARHVSGAELVNARLCAAFHGGSLEGADVSEGVGPALSFTSSKQYYLHFSALVVEEAKATVREGMAVSMSGRAAGLRLRLQSAHRAEERRSRTLGAVCFSLLPAGASDATLRPGGVFVLRSADATLLAVVDGRACGGSSLTFEVLDSALESCASLRAGSEWVAQSVGSVLLEQRCADVCQRRPKPPFMGRLLGGRTPTHTRFGSDASDEGCDEAVGGGGAGSSSHEGHRGTLNQTAPEGRSARNLSRAHLNASQALALDRALDTSACADSLTLLQGPPGTGKTTVLVQLLLELTLSPSADRGRVLVCAPSNKAVQEVLSRFLSALAAATGCEDGEGGDGGGGDGDEWAAEGCATSFSCDHVLLVGDGDKLPDGGEARGVFVFAMVEGWITRLRALADSVVAPAASSAEAEASATVPDALARGASAPAFCGVADKKSLVRVGHTEGCRAAARSHGAALQAALAALRRFGQATRCRLPRSGRALCPLLSRAQAALEDASATLRRHEATWPCALGVACAESARVASGCLDALARQLRTLLEGEGEGLHAEMASAARVVFCTCCVAGSFLVRSLPSAAWLVVDEAAQATEPEALIPLGCEPRRALFAGDPKQLSCVVRSHRALAQGLDRSLLQRLMCAGLF